MTLASGPQPADALAVLYDRLVMVEESLRILELKVNEASRRRPAVATLAVSTLKDVATNRCDWLAQRTSEAHAGPKCSVFGTVAESEMSVVMLEAQPI